MTALFVYGTLKRGMRNHGLVARWVRGVEVAVGPGRLYDVGLYPALVAGPSPVDPVPGPGTSPGTGPGTGSVTGEVLHLDPASANEAVALLDELEGYRSEDPSGSLYVRRGIVVETTDGTRIEAETYFYTGPTGALVELVSGGWTGPSPTVRTGDPELDAFTAHVRTFAVRHAAAPGPGGPEERPPR